MGGVFKTAGITDKGRQEKATEVVFYTIIFGFAILGGVATGKSILHVAKHMSLSNISFASLEGVLTSIKSNEVVKFIKSIKSA
jgi:flagellar motor component MotA